MKRIEERLTLIAEYQTLKQPAFRNIKQQLYRAGLRHL